VNWYGIEHFMAGHAIQDIKQIIEVMIIIFYSHSKRAIIDRTTRRGLNMKTGKVVDIWNMMYRYSIFKYMRVR
jgi:hypothetical protein